MTSSEQLQAYLLWAKDRGLRFPVLAAPLPHPLVSESPTEAAKVVFAGDGPFSGEPRALLDKMIAAMGIAPAEARCIDASAMTPATLAAHVLALHAGLLIIMGSETAARLAPHATTPFAEIRGRVMQLAGFGIPALVTYHPRDLLREPAAKRPAWADLQVAMAALGLGRPR